MIRGRWAQEQDEDEDDVVCKSPKSTQNLNAQRDLWLYVLMDLRHLVNSHSRSVLYQRELPCHPSHCSPSPPQSISISNPVYKEQRDAQKSTWSWCNDYVGTSYPSSSWSSSSSLSEHQFVVWWRYLFLFFLHKLKLTEILSTKNSLLFIIFWTNTNSHSPQEAVLGLFSIPFIQNSSALSFVVCRRASAAAACPPFNLPSQVFFAMPSIFLLHLRSRGIVTYLYLLFALRSVRSWLLHLGFVPPTPVDPNHLHLWGSWLCSVCYSL